MSSEREREEWNTLIRELPEDVFMEIMNNYLGGVDTPYNKTDLLNTLAFRLSRPEYVLRQTSMTSREDILILSAVDWFQCPDVLFLKDFFSSRFSPFEIQNLITNLEERLLIFNTKKSSGLCLSCSPLLPEEIKKDLNPGHLYELHPSLPPETGTLPLLNGSFLICFLSLIHREQQIGNNDGSLKKKFLQKLGQLYPIKIFTNGESEELHLLLNTLKSLKLLKEQGGSWSLRLENLKRYSALDRRTQLLTLWGQIITTDRANPDKGMDFTESLLNQLPANRGIEEDDLISLIRILGDSIYNGPPPLPVMTMIKRFETFNLLLYRDGCYYLHPMLARLTAFPAPQAAGSVFFHATFDVNLTPEAPFSLPMALSLEAERYDSFAQLKMTDRSFASYLKTGMKLEELEKELTVRFSIPLSQNVHFSLQDWEKEYNSCLIWDALVLEVDESRRNVLEQSAALKPYILRYPAPGIFLLSRENKAEWEDILENLGIRTVPHVRKAPETSGNKADFKILDSVKEPMFHHNEPGEAEELPQIAPDHMDLLITKLEALEGLPSEDKRELGERIRRGVIFMEEQLSTTMMKSGIRKVKGLDYQGKLRMIQSVIGNRAWQLDINLPEGDFDIKTHRIVPLKLENQKEADALLIGTELPDKPFQCPVRKISQISKIRVSLF
ncbi:MULTISPECIES: hypothetical protein [unclassified Oceanispirochaeta]|uniref:hypothetical protein n=1 Tax=unclassified Oceanispirochaeta TaxID=2635722 RepID=UPI000E08FF47|nr:MULTISPECIES: hypothetical protein [unclassified Oceanispirochaeta]MBF9014390.1 hypothetical protein [Oceanispirochaeta sp. M2]NPD71276.1 hypothetical protein [Oceanispirochaeta sp. M1]RDG33659.1 hypothetical protein DV872_04105 [Oceanispirochaeta sp. M1]